MGSSRWVRFARRARCVRKVLPARRLLWLAVLVLFVAPAPARAWQTLDVEGMLRRPGVKLVAVEFYATWCKPCNESIPQWQALCERYYDQGLRLIVVSVQSAGQCVAPGWTPDEVVCDDEGDIQRRWQAQKLPQAFLWSWQGHLLASHATAEQVAAQVERYLGQAPRIQVDYPVDPRGARLRGQEVLRGEVQAELRRSAKFDIVANPEELKRVHQQLREGHRDIYSESCKMPIGEAVPANSLLTIVRGQRRRGKATLGLNLRSVKTGCLLASSRVIMGRRASATVVAEAVDKLLRPLMGRARIAGPPTRADESPVAQPPPSAAPGPSTVTAPVPAPAGPAREVGGSDSEWTAAAPVLVEIRTTPPGAAVFVDSSNLGVTPYSEWLKAGPHRLRLVLPGYEEREEAIAVRAAASGAMQKLAYELRPNFGELLVTSEPSGARVLVNGREVGATEYRDPRAALGTKQVRIELADHEPATQQVEVQRGEVAKLHVPLVPTFGTLELASQPPGATVTLDTKESGTTPLTLEHVPAGPHEVLFRLPGHYEVKRRLVLGKGQHQQLREKLEPQLGLLAVVAKDGAGRVVEGRLLVDGQDVGQVPFSGKVVVGRHGLRVVAGQRRGSATVDVPRREVLKVEIRVEDASSSGDYVRIEPGRFTMGSPISEVGRKDYEEQHTVVISRGFWLKATEVTQGEWKRLMGTNPSRFSACGNACPVENVNWWEALAYCNALSRRERLSECYELRGCDSEIAGEGMECEDVRFVGLGCRGYRLPTEAEWEYATRAGTTEARYGELDDVAWHNGNSGSTTHPVGKRRGNAWRLHDTLGSVWEWCWDRYGPLGSGTATDPAGAGHGPSRVARGGSWRRPAEFARAAFRYAISPGYSNLALGFRPARSIR